MSWAHDDLIVEMRQSFEQQLTPQQKMARCKQKRHEQMQRWVAFDTKIGINKVHFQYHQPRRKIAKTKFSKISNASNENHIYFAPNVSLLDAVNRGDVSEITNLLKNGVDPNCADEDGLTALHQACIDNNEEIVKTLLEYGSNVDCRDSEDWTPLHACTTCGHMNIAKILIEHGADILALNADLSMPYVSYTSF